MPVIGLVQAQVRAKTAPRSTARSASNAVPSMPAISTKSGSISAKPVRTGVKDRLAQQEAKLLAGLVACTSIVCGLLVIYLAAYARVASLGLQMSQARVELRSQRLLGESLRAQVAWASSPARISKAAENNHMVLQHTVRICYVDPADQTPPDASPAGDESNRTASTANESLPTAGEPQSIQGTSGTRMASRGTSTGNFTTPSVTN